MLVESVTAGYESTPRLYAHNGAIIRRNKKMAEEEQRLPIFQIKQFMADVKEISDADATQLAMLIAFMDGKGIECDLEPPVQFRGWETKDKKHYKLKEE